MSSGDSNPPIVYSSDGGTGAEQTTELTISSSEEQPTSEVITKEPATSENITVTDVSATEEAITEENITEENITEVNITEEPATVEPVTNEPSTSPEPEAPLIPTIPDISNIPDIPVIPQIPAYTATATSPLIVSNEIVMLNEMSRNAIKLENGWYADPLGNNYWEIFDENGIPVGMVLLPEGEDIMSYDVKHNLIVSREVSVTENTENTEISEIPETSDLTEVFKDNPRTGDSVNFIFVLFGFMAACGIATVSTVKRKKSDIK